MPDNNNNNNPQGSNQSDVDTEAQKFREELIGEGKKYKDENEAIKALYHAQNHIPNLERQNQELFEELDNRLTLEEALSRQSKNTTESRSNDKETDPSQVETNQSVINNLKDDDISELVRKELEKSQSEQRSRENYSQSTDALVESFQGDRKKANEHLNLRAKELGLSLDFLKDIASRSPSGFLDLMEINSGKQKAGNKTSSRSDVNTEGFSRERGQYNQSNPEPGTRAYYEKLRKEDPRGYFSNKALQIEIHNAAMRDPEKFFSN